MKRLFLFLAVVSVLLTGCRSSKTLLEPLTEWNSMSIPFKLEIDGSYSPSGKAYFVRDISVYMSVRVFGMEMLSFYAVSDSVFLWDKTNNILIADRLGVNPLTGKQLTVGQLQDFLLGTGHYATTLNLKLEPLEIKLTPTGMVKLGDTNQTSQWDYTVVNNTTSRNLTGNLKWNYGAVEINPSKLPEWRKPRNPKQILRLNSLTGIIQSQL